MHVKHKYINTRLQAKNLTNIKYNIQNPKNTCVKCKKSNKNAAPNMGQKLNVTIKLLIHKTAYTKQDSNSTQRTM